MQDEIKYFFYGFYYVKKCDTNNIITTHYINIVTVYM